MFRNLLIGRKYLNKDSRLISEISRYVIYWDTSNLLPSYCQKCNIMVLTQQYSTHFTLHVVLYTTGRLQNRWKVNVIWNLKKWGYVLLQT